MSKPRRAWTRERIVSAFESLGLDIIDDLDGVRGHHAIRYRCRVCRHVGTKRPDRAERGDRCLVCARRDRDGAHGGKVVANQSTDPSLLQPCGTRAAYRRGCRCEACKEAALAYRRDAYWKAKGGVAPSKVGMDCLVCGRPLRNHAVTEDCLRRVAGSTWRIT